MDPTLANESAIFPLFIVTQLPLGIAGLVVVAIFAAAMSSLDSSMNSVSAAFTTDFYQRFHQNVSPANALRTARLVTVVIGLLSMAFALWMAAQPDIKSLWDEFSMYIGLFGGGLGGVFLLGHLHPTGQRHRRTDWDSCFRYPAVRHQANGSAASVGLRRDWHHHLFCNRLRRQRCDSRKPPRLIGPHALHAATTLYASERIALMIDHREMLELKRWNTPTIYNGWEQLTDARCGTRRFQS